MRGAIADIWREAELRRNIEEFERLRGQLSTIESDILNAELAPILWKARSKAGVHYDVVQEGKDWRLWRIEDTEGGLTYGQLDEYIDNCTKPSRRSRGWCAGSGATSRRPSGSGRST
jgi:hypothetical protein